jgi:hypothetical protein
MKNKPDIRKFESGGLRDSSEGKLNYYGFRHPLLEQSFAKYMHEHRKMTDGTLRDANNWWKGWDKEVSLQSLVRHVEDLQAINAGYVVIEIRNETGVHKVYHDLSTNEPYVVDEEDDVKVITAEECANAIRFNAEAYKLQLFK